MFKLNQTEQTIGASKNRNIQTFLQRLSVIGFVDHANKTTSTTIQVPKLSKVQQTRKDRETDSFFDRKKKRP